MNITLIVAVAILIEGLVEYGKSVAAMFNGKDTKTGITQIVTIVIGVGLAFAFNADMFVPLGLTVNHYIGMVLTGIMMSRGSNYVSDLMAKIGESIVRKDGV